MVGDRIEVREPGMPLDGKRGRVVAVSPTLLVALDDDPRAIHFGEASLVVLDAPGHHAGAE